MSNVIKSNHYIPLDEIRKLEPIAFRAPESAAAGNKAEETNAEPSEERLRIEKMAERILQDAKAAADNILREAFEEAERTKEQARQEIEAWWNERRREDQAIAEETRRKGYEAGKREGYAEAKAECNAQYESLIQHARSLVEEAHAAKERIIAEAEPFLVELSIAVAKKIIGEHLAVDPNWTITHVSQILKRRRERGVITLLVAPSELAKIQDARGELAMSLDSEADLVIVPDASVEEGGCIVRTGFGSIDARIDTQLAELKAALLELAAHPDEEGTAT